jgi:molybdate transport system substrate-binding protein
VMTSGQADMFVTYCTNAALAKAEAAGLQIVTFPDSLSVAADYGLVVLKNGPGAAAKFADYVLSDAGQAILEKHGFARGGQ